MPFFDLVGLDGATIHSQRYDKALWHNEAMLNYIFAERKQRMIIAIFIKPSGSQRARRSDYAVGWGGKQLQRFAQIFFLLCWSGKIGALKLMEAI